MKKILSIIIGLLMIPSSVFASTLVTSQGGTGTSTKPTLGQVLVGRSDGTYAPVATSSLGISAGSSFSTNPFQATYFTATSTTATSTFPIASSTCFWNGSSCLTSGGTNFFSNSGASTTLTTGTNLISTLGVFGTIQATSTTGTSTFAGAVNMTGKYLQLGTAILTNNNLDLLIGNNDSLTTNSFRLLPYRGDIFLELQASSTSASGTTYFRHAWNGPSSAVDMSINSSGAVNVARGAFQVATTTVSSYFMDNLGIGTTSPSNALEVNGNGYFSGNLTAANITATGTLKVSGNTTLANATSTSFAITGLSNTFLAVNGSGTIIATTTPTGRASSVGASGLVQIASTTSGSFASNALLTVSTSTWQLTANSFNGASSTATSSFAGNVTVGSTTASTTFSVDTNGHEIWGGALPSCDANCTMGYGNDNRFFITTGTAKTTTTITFATAWAAKYVLCSANDMTSTAAAIDASSTLTAVTLNFAALTGANISVSCSGII